MIIIDGGIQVTNVRVKKEKAGQLDDHSRQGVFFFVGNVPATEFLKRQVKLAACDWIHTNECMDTSADGAFAAGDVRDQYLHQVATTVNDGTIAATAAERYIE